MDKRYILFPKASHYAFFHENAHLMLIVWERDEHKELYLITEEQVGHVELNYSGDLFTELVMPVVEQIFFIQVQEHDQEGKYVLGSYFTVGKRVFGAYYNRNVEAALPPEVILFEVIDDGGALSLCELNEDVYEETKDAFVKRYGGHLDIHL